ncbi:hypothetical protein [Ideonella paludis]
MTPHVFHRALLATALGLSSLLACAAPTDEQAVSAALKNNLTAPMRP